MHQRAGDEEVQPSSPTTVRRLPSFRNFELPTPSFTRFASSRTLRNGLPGDGKRIEGDDDLERQELQPLTPHREEVKWEQDYIQAADEDPNLVCTLCFHFERHSTNI